MSSVFKAAHFSRKFGDFVKSHGSLIPLQQKRSEFDLITKMLASDGLVILNCRKNVT